MSVIIYLFPLIISFYTIIFGIENWRVNNRIGFFALAFLALTLIVLPFYLLFLR